MTTYNIYQREGINPPIRVATGVVDKNYAISGLEKGKEYFLSVGAVKNGVEKISDEISFIERVDEILDFLDPIYAIGEYVNITPTLNLSIPVSIDVVEGVLPEGWFLDGVSIKGKATTKSINSFTLKVVNLEGDVLYKKFTLKTQGVVWSQLTFDNKDMTDKIVGNVWSLGVNNTFVEGIDSNYALNLGGTSLPTMVKPFIQSQDFSIHANIMLTVKSNNIDGILYMGNISSNNNRDNVYIGDGEIRSYRQAGVNSGVVLRSGIYPKVGQIYKIGYVKNGNTRQLFVDNKLVASDRYSSNLSNTNNVYVGGGRYDGDPMYSKLILDNIIVVVGEPRFE